MKKVMLLFPLIGLLACQQESDIGPTASSLAGEITGIYRTNGYLDPSCVATPVSQMPSIELKPESENQVTVVYTKRYPSLSSQSIQHVLVKRQPDGVQLVVADSGIGTLQTDRVFTSNGMEKQDKLLRISIQSNSQNINFAGLKP